MVDKIVRVVAIERSHLESIGSALVVHVRIDHDCRSVSFGSNTLLKFLALSLQVTIVIKINNGSYRASFVYATTANSNLIVRLGCNKKSFKCGSAIIFVNHCVLINKKPSHAGFLLELVYIKLDPKPLPCNQRQLACGLAYQFDIQ